MRWRFWHRETAAPVSSECTHLWSNWSAPGECSVAVRPTMWSQETTERDGWAQDRHCLQCNMYQRRVA